MRKIKSYRNVISLPPTLGVSSRVVSDGFMVDSKYGETLVHAYITDSEKVVGAGLSFGVETSYQKLKAPNATATAATASNGATVGDIFTISFYGEGWASKTIYTDNPLVNVIGPITFTCNAAIDAAATLDILVTEINNVLKTIYLPQTAKEWKGQPLSSFFRATKSNDRLVITTQPGYEGGAYGFTLTDGAGTPLADWSISAGTNMGSSYEGWDVKSSTGIASNVSGPSVLAPLDATFTDGGTDFTGIDATDTILISFSGAGWPTALVTNSPYRVTLANLDGATTIDNSITNLNLDLAAAVDVALVATDLSVYLEGYKSVNKLGIRSKTNYQGLNNTITIADGVGTPIADATSLPAAGTYTGSGGLDGEILTVNNNTDNVKDFVRFYVATDGASQLLAGHDLTIDVDFMSSETQFNNESIQVKRISNVFNQDFLTAGTTVNGPAIELGQYNSSAKFIIHIGDDSAITGGAGDIVANLQTSFGKMTDVTYESGLTSTIQDHISEQLTSEDAIWYTIATDNANIINGAGNVLVVNLSDTTPLGKYVRIQFVAGVGGAIAANSDFYVDVELS